MKTVTISAKCDRCGDDVLDTDPGYEILVALGQKRPVAADLCDNCLANAHDALDAAIAAGARPAASNGSNGRGRGNWSKREQISCTICGKSVATGAGQVLHARKIHGLEREEVWAPSTAAEPQLQPA